MRAKNLSNRSNINLAVILLVVALFFSQLAVPVGASDHLFFGKKDSSKKRMDTMSKNPIVEMDTTKGVIKIEIFKEEAPITSNNFLDLVQRNFYNNLTFHRYEPGFCIQGGDPTGTGRGGIVDPNTQRERTIQLEVSPKLRHSEAGMLAMARSNNPDSASSQFYFTLGPASHLDGGYAIFGKVIDGLSVVKELRKGDKMTKVFVLADAHKQSASK